jgi:hypothetical protein
MPTGKLTGISLLALSVVVVLVAMLAQPDLAAGQAAPPGCRIIGRNDLNEAEFDCSVGGSPGRSGGVNTSRSSRPVCSYRPVTVGELAGLTGQPTAPGTDVGTIPPPIDVNGRPHQLMVRTCPGSSELVLVDLAITDVDLAGIAGAQVIGSLPTPQVSFPDPTPQGWFWVKAPVDFRVEPTNIELIEITAEAGGQWATATATPIDVEFSSGDPRGEATVQCSIAGLTAAYERSTPGECSYRYQNASSIVPGHEFEASITVTWEITWVGSSGRRGNLGQFPLTGTTNVVIAEAKALTCAGNNPCTTP